MTRIELPFETACDSAAASISTLAAMLHSLAAACGTRDPSFVLFLRVSRN